MKIPDNTKIQSVGLKVRDLDKSLKFYSDLLGFKEIKRAGNISFLSANGNEPYIIKLIEDKSAKRPHPGTTGLFHTAFRFPSRKELARVFLRLFNNEIKFQGFSDHLVSEAIYLADPDENGVELYVDKPREEWNWNHGEIEMATLPLDLNVITRELDDKNVWNGIHPGTDIGHIHLKVSNISKAEQFYSMLIGFNVTTSSYPGALFMSAGGYHHHIGANIWQSKNGKPAAEDAFGLAGFTIKIPDAEYLKLIEKSAIDQSLTIDKSAEGKLKLKDFDSNNIIVTL